MTHLPTDPARWLRLSLRANATFSAVPGSGMLFAASAIAGLLGIEQTLLVRITGVNLLGFAALLVWLASREVIKPSLAIAVVVADLLWVAGSAGLLPAGVFSTTGNWLVAGVADVVLLFAILQYVGIRRMRAVAQVA